MKSNTLKTNTNDIGLYDDDDDDDNDVDNQMTLIQLVFHRSRARTPARTHIVLYSVNSIRVGVSQRK